MIDTAEVARLEAMTTPALIIARNLINAEHKALEGVSGSFLDRLALHEELAVVEGILVERIIAGRCACK
jgi:hypothetical protein